MRVEEEIRTLSERWDALGRLDPMWAVLTSRNWGEGLEGFFETGRRNLARLFEQMEAAGIHPRSGRALDFGCGLGRVTQALAERFDQVEGVDIAASMIQGAESYNQHGARCRYRVNRAADLGAFPDRSFDFVHSVMTLQHVTPPIALGYLSELVRVTRVGGVLAVQEPAGPAPTFKAFMRTLLPSPLRRLYWRMRSRHPIEMFSIPRERMAASLARAGARLEAALPDTSAGPNYRSYFYLAVRER